jgi:hypothetical protein
MLVRPFFVAWSFREEAIVWSVQTSQVSLQLICIAECSVQHAFIVEHLEQQTGA